jgi:transitional endoplasmic reticulum ATPase
MSPFDDFIHVSTGPPPVSTTDGSPAPGVAGSFLENTKGERLFTEGLIADSIRRNHPKHHLSVTPGYTCDLLAFGQAREDVTISPHGAVDLKERIFMPPARRYNDENGGAFIDRVVFGCYDYVFNDTQFLLYVVEGSDGAYGKTKYNYLLIEDSSMESRVSPQSLSDELIEAATAWYQELHNEVLVFDQGFWQKSPELWQNIQKSKWEDVILEKSKKEAIIEDVIGFFDGEDRYAEFNVPWKASQCTLPSNANTDQNFREVSYSTVHQE